MDMFRSKFQSKNSLTWGNVCGFIYPMAFLWMLNFGWVRGIE